MSKSKIFFSAIPSVVPVVCMVKSVHENIASWLNLHKITYCMVSGTQLPHVEHTIITYISLSHFTFFQWWVLVMLFFQYCCWRFCWYRKHSYLSDVPLVSDVFWWGACIPLLWHRLYNTDQMHKCFYNKHRTLNINLIHSYSFTPCKWNTHYYSIWHIPIYTL